LFTGAGPFADRELRVMIPSTRRSLVVAAILASLGPAAARSGEAVNVWLTTDSLLKRLEPQPPLSFSTAAGGAYALVVDETLTYQQVEGFGAAMTDSAAYLINRVATPESKQSAMERLFTRSGTGIGISFIRIPLGASDLARYLYSYDDLPDGQTDPALDHFDLFHDEDDIIPLLIEARVLNPQLRLMANPWSPPGWMKDSGSMIGGSLLAEMYGPFAGYLMMAIQGYAAAGVPIDYLSIQNEPLYSPPNYAGMLLPAADETTLLRDHLLPALAASGLTTRVLIWDHNWDRPDYPDEVFSDPGVLASPKVAGIAWHGYNGTAGVMTAARERYPSKGNYQTELSGGTWESDQVRADFQNLTHALRNWCRSFVKWGLALDQNRGPHTGGCDSCSPLVTINDVLGTVTYTADFYTLGHFSKFVLPGATRIHSTNGPGLLTSAFLNPDGTKALIVYNNNTTASAFQVQWGGQGFATTLPGLSGATFTWSGAQSGKPTTSPWLQIQASSYSASSGLLTEPTTDTQGGFDVGYADNGDWAVYPRIDFGSGAQGVDVRLASAGSGGRLELRIDSLTGTIISSVPVPITGDWQKWQTVPAAVSSAQGVHDLYLIFKGTSGIGNVNWLRFSRGFIRGDANSDGARDISDAIRSLVVMFEGEASPCPDSIDSNDDGEVDVSDPVYLLEYLFAEGPPLHSPATCGRDLAVDGLGCGPPGGCP
jgi:glucosylceramidase